MFKLTIPGREFWDEEQELFTYTEDVTLRLEHSLASISKWEAKWHKPFLSKQKKSDEEDLSYVVCMSLDEIDPTILLGLRNEDWTAIYEYIEDPMTATVINHGDKKGGSAVVTSEVIYYWMVTYNIPSEYQHWHLNRLLTLIDVCNVKNQDQKSMSKRDILSENAKLNAERRAKMNSKG